MQAKEVRLLVLFVLVLTFYISGLQACGGSSTRNNWHGTINMDCGQGLSIWRLNSFHEDKYEDRQWSFSCHSNPKAKIRYASGDANTYDGKLYFICPRGGYITQMYSDRYRTLYKDRIFKFTCHSPGYFTSHSGCYWSGWQNEYDGRLDFTVPSGYYLAGVESRHYNWAEDRKWAFYLCK